MKSSRSLIVLLISCFTLNVSGFFSTRNKETTCDEPEYIKNGDHKPHAWFIWTHKINAVITFECNAGYQLSGARTARCQWNGEWTDFPSCVALEGAKVGPPVQCPLPPIGDDVEVSPMKSKYAVEESVTFACPGVRKANGYKETVCGQDGKFYPEPPQCIAPKCVPPEIPDNGGLSPNKPSYDVGEVVAFKCSSGYVLVGVQTTRCGEDGYFPYTETSCEAVNQRTHTCRRPYVTKIQNITNDKHSYEEGERVIYHCNRGIKTVGDRVLECLSSGEWSKIPPTCKRVYCICPESPSNGRLENPSKLYYSVDQIATFVCNRGYQIDGEPSSVCRSDGRFHKTPTCVNSA